MRCELSAGNLTQLRSEHSCSGGADLWGKPFAGHSWRRAIRVLLLLAFLPLFASEALPQSNEQPFFGVTIRKALVEQRFSRQRSEQKPVSTSLMNTSVTGMQSTVTETRLRFIPDPNLIRFELLNSGDVTSRTTGINRQAMVDSTGRHHFDVIKPMTFDGSRFLTLPCHGTIQASQMPNRVVSAAGAAMPLLSQVGDRVAWNEVMRRQPQINRAVAEDVSRDVLPKVDSAIDEDFAKLGKQWRAIQRQTAAAFDNTELHWSARSTDSVIALWISPAQPTGSSDVNSLSREATRIADGEEIVLFVSENAVASLLRRYVPTGLKITDSRLQKLQLASDGSEDPSVSLPALVKLVNELRSAKAEEASLFTIEFSSEKPLEVRFVEGDIRIITTFQIHPKIGSSSGWMTTSFNLRGKGVPDDHWAVVVRSVDVGESSVSGSGIAADPDRTEESPASLTIPMEQDNIGLPQDDSGDPAVTKVEAGTVWMTIVRNAAESLAEKLPPVTLPLEFDGSGMIPGSPRLRLSKIESADGMLRVSLRIADSRPVASSRN